MTVHNASASGFPWSAGASLTIDGEPKARDMIRITHANNTHTAAFIEAVDEKRILLAIQGERISLERDGSTGSQARWIAK